MAKITKKQLIDLCVRFSKSPNVKYETSPAHGYCRHEHLILLRRGIEVCRISLYRFPNNQPYQLILSPLKKENASIDITRDDKDWNKVIACFTSNPNNFPTYKKILELL